MASKLWLCVVEAVVWDQVDYRRYKRTTGRFGRWTQLTAFEVVGML